MAKQNFLAGGFVGKLGAFVGVRWRNLRVIKPYVIPTDPKSPKQLACRAVFKDAVPYAQIGMRLNHGAPCWDNERLPEWQQRIGVAYAKVREGLSGEDLIPFFPIGYTPYQTITDISLRRIAELKYAILTSSFETPATTRNFIIGVTALENATGEEDTLFIQCASSSEQEYFATFEVPSGYSIRSGSAFFGVTIDDRENDSNMIFLPPQEVQVTEGTTIVATCSISRSSDNKTLTLAFDFDRTPTNTYKVRVQAIVWQATTGTTAFRTSTFTVNATRKRFNLWKDYGAVFTGGSSIAVSVTEGQTAYETLQVSNFEYVDTTPLQITPLFSNAVLTPVNSGAQVKLSMSLDYPCNLVTTNAFIECMYESVDVTGEDIMMFVDEEPLNNYITSASAFEATYTAPNPESYPVIPQTVGNLGIVFAQDTLSTQYIIFNLTMQDFPNLVLE